MRKTFFRQMPLFESSWLPLERAHELRALSDLLDQHPRAVELIQQDLVKVENVVGAQGMSAEQVLRALLLMRMEKLSYRKLAFYLADSKTYRVFCRLFGDQAPSKSALAANIKAIRAETVEEINRITLGIAVELKVEDGITVRADCTVTKTLMHPPTDSSLLVDGIRVLGHRTLKAQRLVGAEIECVNHLQAAKKCGWLIATSRKGEVRKDLYLQLFSMTDEVASKAALALEKLRAVQIRPRKVAQLIASLEAFLPKVYAVRNQAERRIIHDEDVPAQEKIVSLFESHSDVIIKNWKEVHYGHKVCMVIGKSRMILASWVLKGNPADVTLTQQAIEMAVENLGGLIPTQAAFDGSFKSQANLKGLKQLGVKDVVFSKHRGIKVSDMVEDPESYPKLRSFRAGIEGCISFLKHTFGLDRCTWRTLASFKAWVASATLACNLLLLARSRLALARANL